MKEVLLLVELGIPVFHLPKKLIQMQSPLVRINLPRKMELKGLAFRVGRNNVDVGTDGSNLDTDTYNITYYSTSPVEDDTKFLDTFFGIGKLNSNLLTVIDGRNLSADRSGHQLYGTIRIKDEIKKDNLILIPSGRFDIGHTILGSYKETGTGGIDVEGQNIRSKK